MERTYILHTKSGVKIITETDAINNALDQEKEGVEPHYSFYDYKNCEKVTPPGWLIWSTLHDGCGVVFRRSDGKMFVQTGMQGDFAFF